MKEKEKACISQAIPNGLVLRKDTENSASFQMKPNIPIIDTETIGADLERHSKELQAQPQQAGIFRVRTANQCLADARNQEIPRSLYHNLIFEGEISILFADTGVGKSTLAVQIANEISRTDKVLYIDLELSDKQFQKRYSEDYKNEFVFNDNLIRPDFIRPFTMPKEAEYNAYILESIRQLVTTTGARIVIIDNMTKLVNSDTDTARVAKPLMDELNNLKFEHNLTLLLLEHTRKVGMSQPISLNDLQGSKMKVNFADAVFAIGRSTKDSNLRYIKQLKCRSAEVVFDTENVPIYEIVKENSFLHFRLLNYDTEHNHLEQITIANKENRKEKAVELKAKGLSNVAIAKEFGVTEGAVRKWFNQ